MKIMLFCRFAGALMFCVCTAALGQTVSTEVPILANSAQVLALRPKLAQLDSLMKSKRFDEADRAAAELCKSYEAAFDSTATQKTFPSAVELQEYSKSASGKVEWVDLGYQICLETQAYIASEKKDFAKALNLLEKVQTLAPFSAGAAGEAGYILNQIGKPEEGLAAYRRAYALAIKYESQRPLRAISLRGIGYALIDLKQLDEAERAFITSLELEPGNKTALNELGYIGDQRARK